MSFFKPLTETSANKKISRLHSLIWALIYGGLLTVVLGIFVERTDEPIGWSMVVIGAIAAASGFALIYVRSRMKVDA